MTGQTGRGSGQALDPLPPLENSVHAEHRREKDCATAGGSKAVAE